MNETRWSALWSTMQAKDLTSLEETKQNLSSFFSTATEEFDSRIIAGKSALEQSVGVKGEELSNLIQSTGEAVATLLDTHTVRIGETGDNIPRAMLNIFVGCLAVYATLFGVGYVLYGQHLSKTNRCC